MNIKPFMQNICGYGNCKNTNCTYCKYYNPHIYKIKVPKFIGNLGYYIEYLILEGKKYE